ncbi:hypothetical protein [Deinococcus arcticus]|nr:hypothetical protein [Deinococcus arcticus]
MVTLLIGTLGGKTHFTVDDHPAQLSPQAFLNDLELVLLPD